MPLLQVPFTNSRQKKAFWCWAAVAANCYNSMRPATVEPVSQCYVVTLVESNCEADQPDSLSWALYYLGIMDDQSASPRIAVVEDEFEGFGEEFDPDEGIAEPVCAEIEFPGPAFHEVAITAVDTDTQHVWVADPYVGGPPVEFDWNDFVNNYNYNTVMSMESGGTVQNFQRVVNKWAVAAGPEG